MKSRISLQGIINAGLLIQFWKEVKEKKSPSIRKFMADTVIFSVKINLLKF